MFRDFNEIVCLGMGGSYSEIAKDKLFKAYDLYLYQRSLNTIRECIEYVDEFSNAIAVLPVESFDCENKTYYFINNGKTYNDDIPECIFLAGFDQLMLGYEKKESLFLKPENLRGIFNLAGIVMPSILFNGNVVGRLKKKNGTFTAELFGNVSEKDIKKIKESAAGLWNDITKTNITTK